MDLNLQCQSSIDKIQDWILANRLTLNFEKTCYMLFLPNTYNISLSNFSLTLTGSPLNRVTKVKYLGVLFDEDLTWDLHIQELCLLLRKHVGIFYKLSCTLPLPVLRMLYFALIYPRILYGVELYANTYPNHLHALSVLNNRLLRIIQHRDIRANTLEMYSSFNTLPIDKLFKYQFLLHAHSIFFNSDKMPGLFHYNKLLNTNIHNYSTRSRLDFHRMSTNSSFGAKVSYILYSKLWNSLPSHIKSISSYPIFKKNIRNYLYTNDL